MYRLYELENYLVFAHRAKKVDALREKLFAVFDRIAKLKNPVMYTDRELPQKDATVTDLELGLSVAAASSAPVRRNVPVEVDVDKEKRVQNNISLLEEAKFQYHEELTVLVQEQNNHVESFEKLRSMPVPSRETWSKAFGRQLATGPLDATDYAPLQYSDDLRTTIRSQALFGHEFLMNSNNIFAWLIRWLCTTNSDDLSYTHLNTRRTLFVWNSIVIIGFVLVLILPAVLSLAFELSALQSLGVVTLGGSVVVLTGVKRELALEALFYTFCAYMAVMMTIVFGLGNGNYTVILESINHAG
ncbi:DUF6594 domain-containing protein [Microdochium nivale]|nr:DUF6594 domain-containing protein [Microdochium nivale]